MVVECSSNSVVEVSFGYIVGRRRVGVRTGGGNAKLTVHYNVGVSQASGRPNRNEGRCKNLPGLPVRIFIVLMIQ